MVQVRRLTSLYIKRKEEAFWLAARPRLESTRAARMGAMQRQMTAAVGEREERRVRARLQLMAKKITSHELSVLLARLRQEHWPVANVRPSPP